MRHRAEHPRSARPDASRSRGCADPASPDFYSTSACRDLLFHVQEHRLTLAANRAIPAEHGLSLARLRARCRATWPYRRASRTTRHDRPAKWHRFEIRNPDTFARHVSSSGCRMSRADRYRGGVPMIFRQLFDSVSGTYTYLLASRRGGEALIIDPVIEKVDRYLQLIDELDLKLVKAVDTHLHADHVTGSARCATARMHHRDGRADQGRRRVDAALRRREAHRRGRLARRALHARATPTIPTAT
jgi:hypothetical protein